MDIYAVIGNPISHSKSPEIHTQFAKQTKQNLYYKSLLAPLHAFNITIDTFLHEGGKGANITVPFKIQAYTLAHILTERAKLAGAVNTLKFEHKTIIGDNTDGIGLILDIEKNLGISLINKRILLLGAGGAARGVLLPLLQQKISTLTLCNRSYMKALKLVKQFSKYGHIIASEYSKVCGTYDIIINATSANLTKEIPPISNNIFSGVSLVYDMMYGNCPTIFMKYAAQHGAIVVRDGLGMLIEQAAETFFLWRGIRPKTAEILTMLRSKLTQ